MDKAVEEEFSVWKKNTPLLYDLTLCHPLDWSSPTVQWLPSPDGGDIAVHKLILATHTSGDVPNFLMLADAHLPSDPASAVDPHNSIVPKLEIVQKIQVDGEVNRARCMPQNQAIIAAKTNGSQVYIFDSTKQLEVPDQGSFNPNLKLRGHDKGGYGLSWSTFKEGFLLSGSNDCRICLWWGVSAMPQANVLESNYAYEGHEGVVKDVSWHLKNENLFGSVGDDCKLMLWDFRMRKFQNSVVHKREVNHLSFNPFNEHVLATASSDTTVGLFDMRNLSSPLHSLSNHKEKVFQVEWDPNHEAILASSGADRRLIVWDVNRIGDEQLEVEAKDGPPELIFAHVGHKAKISDFSWNKKEPWLMSSVADDKMLQIWQMSESTHRNEDDNTTIT